MKKKFLEKFGLIDEKYIDEASPLSVDRAIEKEINKAKKVRRLGFGIVGLVMVVALSLWLFIPYSTTAPSVAKYSSSPYYSVIKKLNEATYVKPKYKNNFQMLVRNLFSVKMSAGGMDAMPESDRVEYVETTDNQVAGIIEADRIKRSSEHIFFLDGNVLKVFNISGKETTQVATFSIFSDYGYLGVSRLWEFYLSKDCKTVTVIMPTYQQKVEILSLDVENLNDIKEISRIEFSGNYKTSRLVDGRLLVVNNFTVKRGADFGNEENFLPQITQNGKVTTVSAEDIVYPEKLSLSTYTVVCTIKEGDLKVEDFTAYLSYSDTVYVSNEYVYVTRSFTKEEPTDKKSYTKRKTFTEIIPISYTGDGLSENKAVEVEGYLKDQYSLDEYDNYLRAVTTNSETTVSERNNGEFVSVSLDSSNTSASLFVVDLKNMDIVARVEKFAPTGEVVRSVRFDKTKAYVCTAVVLTDPVFYFDLSDLNNITYKDTGTIDGYSTSLINFGNGNLLGVGVGESFDTVKIEVYEETFSSVSSTCSVSVPNAYYSENYKSYFIDRENKYIGLGLETYRTEIKEGRVFRIKYVVYALYQFDGNKLSEILFVELNGYPEHMRATLIDGFFYIFGEGEFKVFNLNE